MRKHLIFLHGALGSKLQFIKLQELLSADYKLHSINFSGHGDNFSTKEFSIAIFVEEVINYMDKHSLKSACIFGYSMGGYVGLKIALDHPERVEKLITLGTKFHWSKEIAEKEVSMLNPEKMEQKIPKFVAQLKATHSAHNWKELVDKTANLMLNLGNTATFTEEDIRNIKTPVLVLRGDNDKMLDREESESLANTLPNASYLEINNSNHPFDRVDQFRLVEILKDFLK